MVSETPPFGQETCHICGGTIFIQGQTPLYTGQSMVFRPRNRPEIALNLDNELTARCCDTCGNIQWFVQNDRKRKED